MWADILIALRKYLGFLIVCFVVVSMFTFMSFKNYRLQTSINSLEQEKVIIAQARELEKQKAITEIKTLSEQYQQESLNREKYYAEKYQELLSNYESTKSSVSGLYDTTNEIRDRVHSTNTSRETIVKYVDKYETVFKECVNEYTEVAKDAEELVLINQSLNSEIESIYNLMDDYRKKNPTISSD